jgi:hypothetical protein
MPAAAPPRKKSNAVWWVLGGVAALGIIGIGLVVMIIALASMRAANSNNGNLNRNENHNANVVSNTNTSRPNTNSSLTPGSLSMTSLNPNGAPANQFGHIWYDGDEYHMSSKDKTFIVMYAPSDDYNTADATVKVKARSVDGTSPSSGFGLMVHCAQSKAKQLEDYALLIYPSDSPEYEIIMHKDGTQTSLVNKTPSTAIHSGTTPNLLEVRIKGSELSFYANGEFLTKVNDTGNYKRGRAGFIQATLLKSRLMISRSLTNVTDLSVIRLQIQFTHRPQSVPRRDELKLIGRYAGQPQSGSRTL